MCDGTNVDDLKDIRPGRKAAREFGIRSPLLDVKLTKEDIRNLSRELRLPTWNKPSFACLSSRIPYGEKITNENLSRIEKAEKFISTFGFKLFRVRTHGNIARIEIDPSDISQFNRKNIREEISNKLKSLGFVYITLDLQGF